MEEILDTEVTQTIVVTQSNTHPMHDSVESSLPEAEILMPGQSSSQLEQDLPVTPIPESPIPVTAPTDTETQPPPLQSPVPPEPPLLKKKKKGRQIAAPSIRKQDVAAAQMFEERCRQLGVSIFFREQDVVRSLGFISAIQGEGKSFLSIITAQALAKDSSQPITLVDCNWEHPDIHRYFDIPATPGLAEWLRGECSPHAVRHRIQPNLTVIPAGNGREEAIRLLQQIKEQGLLNTFTTPDELYIVDLPAITSTGYGMLAASLVESLVVVVRAGVTPDGIIAETFRQIKDYPVYGVLLNQQKSHIPEWIRRLL